MTAAAIVILAIWAVGIVVLTATFRSMAREHPEIEAGFLLAPAAAGMLAALVTVFWPAALVAAGLVRLAGRWSR